MRVLKVFGLLLERVCGAARGAVGRAAGLHEGHHREAASRRRLPGPRHRNPQTGRRVRDRPSGVRVHLTAHAYRRAAVPAPELGVRGARVTREREVLGPHPARVGAGVRLEAPPRLRDLLLLHHWLVGQRWQEEAYPAVKSPSGIARGVQQCQTI